MATFLFQRLGLGFALILLASSILLGTDRDRRDAGGPKVWRVAIVQHASVPVLDDGLAGVLAALTDAGFHDGDSIQISRYNAEGDLGTANTIAREVVSGPFDLIISLSTVSMQSIANANQQKRRPHVFGLVADPYSAGVGLDAADPMKHPPYMVGQGIFLPVEDSFRLARQLLPELKRVGVVWNPAESNSLAFTKKAREACQKLGLELLEANADTSAAVLEAAQSLIARAVQLLWVGGDVTVMAALDGLIALARKEGVPVVSITPGKPERGTLFDLGVNFLECGKLTGRLAIEVMHGADPARIPIRDVLDLVPRRLIVNRQALRGLKERWQFPPDLLRRADLVVEEKQ